MLVRNVMSVPPITLKELTPVHAAAALLISHGYTGAPVVGAGGQVVGIATGADLVRGRVVPEGWVVEDGLMPTVGEVMTRTPIVRGPDDDLADVSALMLDLGIRVVPIVADGELVGVLTRGDVLRAVAKRMLRAEDSWNSRPALAGNDRGDT